MFRLYKAQFGVAARPPFYDPTYKGSNTEHARHKEVWTSGVQERLQQPKHAEVQDSSLIVSR